mmetsp:Transcript_65879/g.174702  ORF Transcript_65879/g.174702 Transcript_65879/m.174702 type:complete len:95 (+) Transcript_65879:768-1052(+)
MSYDVEMAKAEITAHSNEKKFKKTMVENTPLRYGEKDFKPTTPILEQSMFDSTTPPRFSNSGGAGRVYSLEKWRAKELSGLTVGAQNPPQMGIL